MIPSKRTILAVTMLLAACPAVPSDDPCDLARELSEPKQRIAPVRTALINLARQCVEDPDADGCDAVDTRRLEPSDKIRKCWTEYDVASCRALEVALGRTISWLKSRCGQSDTDACTLLGTTVQDFELERAEQVAMVGSGTPDRLIALGVDPELAAAQAACGKKAYFDIMVQLCEKEKAVRINWHEPPRLPEDCRRWADQKIQDKYGESPTG